MINEHDLDEFLTNLNFISGYWIDYSKIHGTTSNLYNGEYIKKRFLKILNTIEKNSEEDFKYSINLEFDSKYFFESFRENLDKIAEPSDLLLIIPDLLRLIALLQGYKLKDDNMLKQVPKRNHKVFYLPLFDNTISEIISEKNLGRDAFEGQKHIGKLLAEQKKIVFDLKKEGYSIKEISFITKFSTYKCKELLE